MLNLHRIGAWGEGEQGPNRVVAFPHQTLRPMQRLPEQLGFRPSHCWKQGRSIRCSSVELRKSRACPRRLKLVEGDARIRTDFEVEPPITI